MVTVIVYIFGGILRSAEKLDFPSFGLCLIAHSDMIPRNAQLNINANATLDI